MKARLMLLALLVPLVFLYGGVTNDLQEPIKFVPVYELQGGLVQDPFDCQQIPSPYPTLAGCQAKLPRYYLGMTLKGYRLRFNKQWVWPSFASLDLSWLLRLSPIGSASGDEDGAVANRSNTVSGVNFPKTTDWQGSPQTWGTPEVELSTAGAGVENVQVVWDPADSSTVFYIAVNATSTVTVYRCTAVDTCSSDVTATIQGPFQTPSRHWDIEIEQSSGDVLLFYDNPAAVADDFCFKTRSAGVWSGETCMNNTAVATVNPAFVWTVLASNRGSNRIAAGAFDTTNDDFILQVWDGATWVNANKACSAAVTLTGGLGGTVLAEDTADEFVAYCGNGANSVAECEWTSAGGWEATCATFDPDATAGNDVKSMEARANWGTNTGLICHDNDINDPSCWVWDGISGTGGTRGANIELTANNGCGATISICLGMDWNPDQSTVRDAIIAFYGNSVGNISWGTVDDASNLFTLQGSFASAGSHLWIYGFRTESTTNSVKVHIGVSNSNFDVLFYRWDGSLNAPTNEQTITADTVNEGFPYFHFAPLRSPATRYAVLNDAACTGDNWNTVNCWSRSSGGASGASVPTASNDCFFDANSGAGTMTLDVNANCGSLNTTGFTGTIALATFNLQILNDNGKSGSVSHAAGVITIGNSVASGLVIDATLTISGSASIQCGTNTCKGVISGNALISSATAFIDFGLLGSWAFKGTYNNSSTSASWDAGTDLIDFTSLTGGTMTFAGANLAEDEFFDIEFFSDAVTGQTFTMATRGLRWGGTLFINDSSGTTTLATSDLSLTGGNLSVGNLGILTANATTATLVDVTMTGGVSGTITLTTGAWTPSGNWNTSGLGSTYTQGTGIVTMSGTSKTINMLSTDNDFDDLTISGTITLASAIDITNALTISGGTFAKSTFAITATDLTMSGGDLTSTSGNVTISGAVNISAAASAIDFGSEQWTQTGTGCWTNASTDAGTWDSGTGKIVFNTSASCTFTFAGANLGENEFNNVDFLSAGPGPVIFTMATRALQIAGALLVDDSDGSTQLATAGLAITAGSLQVNRGGSIVAGASIVTINGAIEIGPTVVADTYITSTAAGAWTGSGAWTNAATSASWSFAAPMTFNAAAGATMTFAGDNLTQEFAGNVTFNSTGATPQTFTMATRGLKWGGTLTISDGVSTTTLATVGLALTGSSVTIGVGGVLTPGASAVNLSGNWNSTPGTLSANTGTYTFTGGSGTIDMAASHEFDTMTMTGTRTGNTNVQARIMTINGTLSIGMNSIAFRNLDIAATGTLTMDGFNVQDFHESQTDNTSRTTINNWSAYDAAIGPVEWTHTVTVGASTLTWTVNMLDVGDSFTVKKNGIDFDSGTVDGSGNVIFTMLGSDPVMLIEEAAAAVPAVAGGYLMHMGVEAWFTWTSPNTLQPYVIRFEDMTSRDQRDTLTWHWDFGDGTTAEGPVVVHEYANVFWQSYQVKLTVTGQTDSDTVEFSINVANPYPVVLPLSIILLIAAMAGWSYSQRWFIKGRKRT